ncbi:MAG: hypothetical protein V3U92_19680 [Cellulophaga sp.]
MGKFVDFIVDYDPDPRVVGKRILKNITTMRLKYNKPCIIFVGGDSGEGKSTFGIKLLEIVDEAYGVELDIENQIIYIPLEYAHKIKKILYGKGKFKKYRAIQLDEAREVIKAKLWYTFINQALADINVLTRAIKPIVTIIISQKIKDIDSSIRSTLTYYMTASRPLGKRTRVKIWRLWMDDRDIENPRLRKRRLKGYIIKDGKRIPFTPKYFEVEMPSKKIMKEYNETNTKAKGDIIKRKLDAILQEIKEDLGEPLERVTTIANYYVNNPESIHLVMRRYRNKLKAKTEVKKLHGFTVKESKEFEKILMEKLEKKGMVEQAKKSI